MVAGGGGASYATGVYTSGYGGTLYGTRTINTEWQQYLSNPGTQTSGGAAPTMRNGAESNGTAGSFGKGGAGGASKSTSPGGGGSGGGSGYYGASGTSGAQSGSWPSSGGSSYISGYAGVNSVENNTTITHTNQTIHYSGKYFVGGQMIEGQNSGNGYAKITYVHNKPQRKSTKLNNVRYIKDCTSYNTSTSANNWVELQAIKDGVNIAKGKTVTGTTNQNSSYPYSRITDGDITYSNYATPSTASTKQCITVDLENTYDLDEVAVWNYFGDQRRYISNDFQVSEDNNTWTNLSEEESWYETSNGARYNAYIDNINGYSARNKMTMWLDGLANTGTTRNNTTTNWKNLSTNSSDYTATVSGATWINDSLSFDGTNDYVTFTNKEYTFPMTYSFIYKTNSTDSQIIFGHNLNNAAIGLYQNNKFITSLVSATNMYDAGTITLDKYYKVDVIFRSLTDKTIYVNNKEIPQLSSTEYWSWTESKSYIGKRPSGTYFKGNIRLFQIFSGELTKEEISHNYNYDKQRFNLE